MTTSLQTTRPQTLDDAIAQVDALWKMVESMTTLLEEQQSLIDDLRSQVAEEEAMSEGQHSGNSSSPPSSDTAAQRGKRDILGCTERADGPRTDRLHLRADGLDLPHRSANPPEQ